MPEQLLRLENVTRRITSEFYIRGIDLTLYRGEVLALAGKNAAGKSTLAGVVNGALPADSGRIWFEGRAVEIDSPAAAMELGIVTLAQNTPGFEDLTVADNVLMGNPKYFKTGGLTPKRMRAVCQPCFDELGIAVDPGARFGDLTPAQKQAVALARARLFDAKLIILDEPSSRLTETDCETLYRMVRRLRGAGVSILYITHRLREILALADRVAFVERGEIKLVRETAGLTELDLIEQIEGHSVGDLYGRADRAEPGEPLLEVEHLSAGETRDVSLTVRHGELVAVLSDGGQGMQGLLHALLGLTSHTGVIRLDGREAALTSPLEADALRIVAAVDEDTEELLATYDSKGGRATGRLSALGAGWKQLTISMGRMTRKMVGMKQEVEYMTGGFRQRELMQRTLGRDGDLYLMVDATNGVDFQTRLRIYNDLGALLARGRGVLYFTNDVAEAAGLADRVLVLRGNTIVFERYAKEIDAATLTKLLKG